MPYSDFYNYLTQSGFEDSEQESIKELLFYVEAPPFCTHLFELFSELYSLLPIAAKLDSSNRDKLTKLFNVVDKLFIGHQKLLREQPRYQPHSMRTGTLQGLNSQHPIYACFVQEGMVSSLHLEIPKALLLVLLISPTDRFSFRGKRGAVMKDLADAMRKGVTRSPVWHQLMSRFPSQEGFLDLDNKHADLKKLIDERNLTSLFGRDEPWKSSELRPLRTCEIILSGLEQEQIARSTQEATSSTKNLNSGQTKDRKEAPRKTAYRNNAGSGTPNARKSIKNLAHVKAIPNSIKDNFLDKDAIPEIELLGEAQLIEISPAPLLPLVTSSQIRAFFAYAKYATEMDNQHLLWKWSALNKYDISILGQELNRLLESNNLEEVKIGLCGALMLLMGRGIEEIYDITISIHYEDLDKKKLANSPPLISLSDRSWLHVQTVPEGRYLPNDMEKNQLQLVGDLLRLPLPEELVEAFSRFNFSQRLSIREIIELDSNKMLMKMRHHFKTIRRRNKGVRITPPRIRDALSFYLMRESSDPVLVASILGGARFPLGGAPYYATFEAKGLQSIYVKAINRMGVFRELPEPTTDNVMDIPVGSRLLPRSRVISGLSQKLSEQVNETRPTQTPAPKESLIFFHNAFVTYTLSMLMFATGHRSVNDPFESFEYISEELGIALISDKAHQQAEEGRAVVISSLARKQLQAYKKHLLGLASRIVKFDGDLAGQIEATAQGGKDGLWLFFELDEVLQPAGFSKKTLEQKWRENDFSLPVNATRHILASALRNKKLPAEYIWAQLGHALEGQQLYGKSSLVNPSHYTEAVSKVIDEILQAQGWINQEGIKIYRQKQHKPLASKTKHNHLRGHQIRSSSRQKRAAAKHRIILGNLLTKINPEGEWTPESVDKLKNTIHKLPEPAYIISRISLLAARYLKRIAPSIMERVNWPSRIIVRKDTSVIKLTDAKRYRQLRGLKNRLKQEIEREPIPATSELAARIIILASTQGVTSSQRLGQLMTALLDDRIYMVNNCMWLECGNEPVLRRWFPQGSALLLCIAWLNHKRDDAKEHDILKAISNKWLPESDPKMVLHELAKMGDAFQRLTMPGYLATYGREESPATSVSLQTWTRLLTNKPIYVEKLTQPNMTYNPLPPIFSGRIDEQASYAIWAKARGFLLQLDNGKISRSSVVAELQVDDYEGIAPIAQALNEWIINELSDKKRLASSSVRNYALNIGGFLLISGIGIEDYFQLDEDQFTELYLRVSNMGQESNRAARLKLIKRFHDFVQKQFGAKGFLPSELGLGDPYGVSANIITEQEYQRAGAWIAEQKEVSPSLRREASMVLLVLFYLGVRVGEAARLRPKDIVLRAPGIVLIRSYANQRTKTISGQRQINCEARLPKSEFNKLTAYIEDINHQRVKEKYIFPNFITSERNQLSTSYLALQAIRQVTGDNRLTLRNLRHSASTWNLLNADMDPEILPSHWRSEIDKGMATESNFGRNTPEVTRRYNYNLAREQGHAHPVTTMRHYCHLLDWRIALYYKADDIELAGKTVAALVGMTHANYRNIARRTTSKTGFMEKLLKRANLSSEVKNEINLITSEIQVSDEVDKGVEVYDTAAIANALERFALGDDYERIAADTTYPREQVVTWCEQAVELEKEVGYKHWMLSERPQKQRPKRPRNNTMPRMVRELEKLAVEQEPIIMAYLSVWRGFYRHDLIPLYVADIDACIAVIEAFELLGISKQEIVIKIPSNHPYFQSRQMIEVVRKACGVEKIEVIRNRSINVKVGFKNQIPGLGIEIMTLNNTGDNELKTMRAIHYASFLHNVAEGGDF